MKVSELCEDLKNKPPSAELFVSGLGHPIWVESVAPECSEEVVFLVARSDEPPEPPLNDRMHKIESRKSEKDGKYELLQDGEILLSGIDTEHDAEMCGRAFVEGIKTSAELFRPLRPGFSPAMECVE